MILGKALTGRNRRMGRGSGKDARLREALDLRRRYCDLSRAAREGEVLIPLPEPVLAGWERYFFVRPDLARSPEGPTLAKLLNIAQRVEVSGRKDFARRDWRRGNKLRPHPHHLGVLREREFWALDEQLQRYFMLAVERDRRGKTHHSFVVKDSWKFVSRTRRYYLTHRAIPDGEILAELKFVDDQLYGPMQKVRPLWRREGSWYERYDDETPGDMRLRVASEAEEAEGTGNGDALR